MAGRKAITACTSAEWRQICANAKASIPPPEGWRWDLQWSRAVEKTGARGDCSRDEKRKTIRIRVLRGMSETETEDTLLHEMAHGFDRWDHHGWAGDHSDTFWLWFGRLSRRYHGQETG